MNPKLDKPTFFEYALTLLSVGAFGTVFAIAALEWASGCGESWVDAKGVRQHGQCLIIGGLLK